MNTSTELSVIIDYDEDEQAYLVLDAETEVHLFTEASLQAAWDEFKDECERRGVAMGLCDYRYKGPADFDEIRL